MLDSTVQANEETGDRGGGEKGGCTQPGAQKHRKRVPTAVDIYMMNVGQGCSIAGLLPFGTR